MANPVTALAEETSPLGTDLLYMVDDPGGTPLEKKLQISNLPGAGSDFTEIVPCIISVAEGTVAFPDIHILVTAGGKVSGWVLPDGAATGIINFKCVIPPDLNAAPNMRIRVRIMTQSALAASNVRLTLRTVGRADGESLDFAYTGEAEVSVAMPTTIETLDYYVETLGTNWAVGDTMIGQLERQPQDASDTHAGDILIVAIDLLVDRTTT